MGTDSNDFCTKKEYFATGTLKNQYIERETKTFMKRTETKNKKAPKSHPLHNYGREAELDLLFAVPVLEITEQDILK